MKRISRLKKFSFSSLLNRKSFWGIYSYVKSPESPKETFQSTANLRSRRLPEATIITRACAAHQQGRISRSSAIFISPNLAA